MMSIRLWVYAAFLVIGELIVPAGVWGQGKPLPETHNAALRYWQAFAELKDPPPNQELQAEMEQILNAKAEWDEAKVGGVVAANEIALGIMQRATKLPDCDWGVEYTRGPEASMAFVPRAHVLARLNMLQGVREMAQGHSQAAVDAWIAGIRFAQDLTKGGSLIFALTAKSVLLQEMRTLTAEAKQGRLTKLQRKQLYSAVSALPEDGFDWGLAWEMDEAGADVFFGELQRSQKPATLFEKLMGQAAPKDCMPPSAQQVKVYREYMSDVASALRLQASETKQRLADLDGKSKSICEAIRQAIPSAERVNDARVEVVSARKDLLDALQVR
ncbi:MAG: hypothetical protein ACLPHP_12325 [Candidatus Sulfotelmatobacter sp.]